MERIDLRSIADKWLAAFAPDADADALAKYVTGEYNFLWHIFSWELVPCLEEDAAREAFDALAYESAILFRLGQRRNGEFALRDVSIVGKISAAELDSPVDTYVTAPDFAWTYVHTHEDCCGPYFCRRKVPSSFPTR